jgi:hypothetical protein
LQVFNLLPDARFALPAEVQQANVHIPSRAADSGNQVAVTHNREIHLGSQLSRLATDAQQRVIAHEVVHLMQQSLPVGGAGGSALAAEHEAHALTGNVLRGGRVAPKVAVAPTQALAWTHDDVVVARARKQLPVLRKFVGEWTAREARRLRIASEKGKLLSARQRMDATSADPFGYLREPVESQNLQSLNRRPLKIDVTASEIKFTVHFHARFENPRHKGRFATLKTAIEKGIQLIWNQRLLKTFPGRSFSIVPKITHISATAARNRDFWLITVRPTNTGAITYPGCTLPAPPAGVTVAVTDSTCDGGVMSLPPKGISDASLIGHELLHLFGLVDRYMMLTQRLRGRTVTQTIPSRTTGGRKDPLGGETGKILIEDLAFVFDKLGVYKLEEARGLDTLKRLEARGMTLYSALAKIRRLEEIIKHGRDPRSLIQYRQSFRKEILDSARGL